MAVSSRPTGSASVHPLGARGNGQVTNLSAHSAEEVPAVAVFGVALMLQLLDVVELDVGELRLTVFNFTPP